MNYRRGRSRSGSDENRRGRHGDTKKDKHTHHSDERDYRDRSQHEGDFRNRGVRNTSRDHRDSYHASKRSTYCPYRDSRQMRVVDNYRQSSAHTSSSRKHDDNNSKTMLIQFTQHDERTENAWSDLKVSIKASVGEVRDKIMETLKHQESVREDSSNTALHQVPILLYSIDQNETYTRLFAAMNLKEAGLLEGGCKVVWAKSGESQPISKKSVNTKTSTGANSSNFKYGPSGGGGGSDLPSSSQYSFKYAGQRPTRTELNELEEAFGGGPSVDPCMETWLEGDQVPLGKEWR